MCAGTVELLARVKLSILNTSVVVLADAHNPSILHPSFLKAQAIVPAEWELADAPVCTPAISVARFKNGIVFTVELPKFQVQDSTPNEASLIWELATKYVSELPHVHYKAVGINVAGLVECEKPEQWIVERFIKSGPWNDDQVHPQAVGMKFVYPVAGARLNLSCDAGTLRSLDPTAPNKTALLINGNYHTDLKREGAFEGVKHALAKYHERVAHFVSLTQAVFGLEK